jgi:peptidoglycan/xylan/chitin deacetylase (PgdA/CDA1 family)
MYHYVRPIIASKFPSIKGLELSSFTRQLDYISSRFSVISTSDLTASIKTGKHLPEKACWLTFDDGYRDHFNYVLPELINRGLTGAFFPPEAAICGNVILDVNAIHHILANCDNLNTLRITLDKLCLDSGISKSKLNTFWKKYGISNRFDDATTLYLKRMLQHALPESLRTQIIGQLFKDFVGVSQKDFSNELYMSTYEAAKMIDSGMYVGNHGSKHSHLDQISEEEQRSDIAKGLNFLEEIGAPTKDWIMCYPYGGFNKTTLSIVKSMGAAAGITTEVRQANLCLDNHLALPRFDTNDFPQ